MDEELLRACFEGNLEVLAKCAETDRKVVNEKIDELENRPLHVAAEFGHVALARWLLEHKAKVDAKNKDSRTALQLAALAQHGEVVKLLKDAGSDVNIAPKTALPWPVLMQCVSDGDWEASQMLIDAGADCNLSNKKVLSSLRTPMHLLVEGSHKDWRTYPEKQIAVLKEMLAHGGDPNLQDKEGESAFHLAAVEGQSMLIEPLVKGGAKLEGRDPDGATALFYAVIGGNLETVRVLLKLGADTNHKVSAKPSPIAWDGDTRPRTALEMAVLFRHKYIVRMLAKHMKVREPEIKDETRPAEFPSAIEHGQIADVRELLDDDPSLANSSAPLGMMEASALSAAAVFGRTEIAELLLARGAAVVPERRSFGTTPLHDAVKYQQEEIVRGLLKRGADINRTEQFGDTPLHYAATVTEWSTPEEVQRSERITELLLNHGANPRAAKSPSAGSKYGDTPLHGATRSPKLVKMLLKAGAELDVPGNGGARPLYHAVTENIESTSILLVAGADINAPGFGGRTSLAAVRHLIEYRAFTAQGLQRMDMLKRVEELLLSRGAR